MLFSFTIPFKTSNVVFISTNDGSDARVGHHLLLTYRIVNKIAPAMQNAMKPPHNNIASESTNPATMNINVTSTLVNDKYVTLVLFLMELHDGILLEGGGNLTRMGSFIALAS